MRCFISSWAISAIVWSSNRAKNAESRARCGMLISSYAFPFLRAATGHAPSRSREPSRTLSGDFGAFWGFLLTSRAASFVNQSFTEPAFTRRLTSQRSLSRFNARYSGLSQCVVIGLRNDHTMLHWRSTIVFARIVTPHFFRSGRTVMPHSCNRNSRTSSLIGCNRSVCNGSGSASPSTTRLNVPPVKRK